MLRARPRPAIVVLLLVVLAMAALAWFARAGKSAPGEPVGLFTTLPLLWNESPDAATALNPDNRPHWAKVAIAERGAIVPLDLLSGPAGHAPLNGVRRLVIAQPRVLSPQENVALDAWVRGGGRLLLLADPALTEESVFPLGDPRRPQTVALLSPILSHWGLDLRFRDDQPAGEGARAVMGVQIPVNLPGHFTTRGQNNCRVWGDGLAVTCAIGKGRIVALADAAVLERENAGHDRRVALDWLLDAAFVGN